MTQVSKNIVLVSGSGRNVGKTSFIRQIIERNADQKLIAIKITPHFHEPTEGLQTIETHENYRIFQETETSSGKDSSLFLQSGAGKVFFIQTKESGLKDAFRKTLSLFESGLPIVVESAALRKILIPALYLFIRREGDALKPSATEMMKLADRVVFSNDTTFNLNPKCVTFNQIWKIEKE